MFRRGGYLCLGGLSRERRRSCEVRQVGLSLFQVLDLLDLGLLRRVDLFKERKLMSGGSLHRWVRVLFCLLNAAVIWCILCG